jgi:uncharacterized SAM-dependent methyltransferase
MPDTVNVTIHASQFPDSVRRDLLASLRSRQINPKFHYDSVKQTQKWLALHQAYAPSRKDPGCQAIYEKAFQAVASEVKARHVHVVGLGCGGGQKDTRLLKLLKSRRRAVFYTPCDVSPAMVLVARQTALAVLAKKNCFPFVCDLAITDDLAAALDSQVAHRAPRIPTFFGMIPNFEPPDILPKLAALVRPGDFLLFSANLAPGQNYADGMKKILPQYSNQLTRDWLMTFLLDLGVESSDGDLAFTVEDGRFALKRFVARFHFRRSRRVEIDGERFAFRAGSSIQLFFSYRYPPERVPKILAEYDLEVCENWMAKSGEEGVFLCRRQ